MSDSKPKFIEPFAHRTVFPIVTSADLADATSGVNTDLGGGVKARGSMVMAIVGAGRYVYAAEGPKPTDAWKRLDTGADVVPTGTPNAGGIAGDVKPKYVQPIVGGLEMPIVQEADLIDQSHPVNRADLSGKRITAVVIVERADGAWEWVTALGADDNSEWKGNVNKYTPVGGSQPVDGHKPVAYGEYPVCPYLEVTVTAELADIDDVKNAGDGVYNGKVAGSLISNSTDATMRLAAGPLPSDPWVRIFNADDATGIINPA